MCRRCKFSMVRGLAGVLTSPACPRGRGRWSGGRPARGGCPPAPRGEAGGTHPQRLDGPGDIQRGGVPLHRGGQGQDDLLHRVVGQTVEQGADGQVLAAHPLDRVEQPVQHMVQAAVLPGALDGLDVLRGLDHADGGMVPRLVGADGADLPLGVVLAQPAAVEAGVHPLDGRDQLAGLLFRQVHQLVGQAGGGLFPEAGQPLELVDQHLEWYGGTIHPAPPLTARGRGCPALRSACPSRRRRLHPPSAPRR